MQNAPMPEANIMTFDNLLFSLAGMSCCRVIQAESSSSNPDVGQFFLVALVTKSFEVLAFNLHVKAHVKISA